jgi:hypothetical protein
MNIYVSLCLAILVACSLAFTKDKRKLAPQECIVCDRVALFEKVKQKVADEYWPSFTTGSFTPPMVYFDDSASWLAYAPKMLFPNIGYDRVQCAKDLAIYRMKGRIDKVPFHMENKMTFQDSSMPYYFRPIMFCSDVERTNQLVPEVKHTDEWLQLVMHEYFHAFQFSHRRSMLFVKDSVEVQADSLNNYYRKHEWFKELLVKENDLLLHAIHSNHDSTSIYYKQFLEVRRQRRSRVQSESHFDIIRSEKFWEKIEGTARYMEYNMGFIFLQMQGHVPQLHCDTFFNSFKDYGRPDFENEPWFYEKTQMMVAYYYVTGFNLCRLMDKLKIEAYKKQPFDEPHIGPEDYIGL